MMLDDVNREFLNIEKYFTTVTDDLQDKIDKLVTVDTLESLHPILFEYKSEGSNRITLKPEEEWKHTFDGFKDNGFIKLITGGKQLAVVEVTVCQSNGSINVYNQYGNRSKLEPSINYNRVFVANFHVGSNRDFEIIITNENYVDINIDYISIRGWFL